MGPGGFLHKTQRGREGPLIPRGPPPAWGLTPPAAGHSPTRRARGAGGHPTQGGAPHFPARAPPCPEGSCQTPVLLPGTFPRRLGCPHPTRSSQGLPALSFASYGGRTPAFPRRFVIERPWLASLPPLARPRRRLGNPASRERALPSAPAFPLEATLIESILPNSKRSFQASLGGFTNEKQPQAKGAGSTRLPHPSPFPPLGGRTRRT